MAQPKARDDLTFNITGLEPAAPGIYPLAFSNPLAGLCEAQEMGKWEPGSALYRVGQLLPSPEPQEDAGSRTCRWFAPGPTWRAQTGAAAQNACLLCENPAGEGK